MLCLVRKSLILLFKKRLFKTLYTMYSTVHSKATVTGHQIVPADRQLKIAQLGVCWEAPSFQESLEPHVTEDTSSVLQVHADLLYTRIVSSIHRCVLYSRVSQYVSNLLFFNVFMIRLAHIHPKVTKHAIFWDSCKIRLWKLKTVQIFCKVLYKKSFR